MDIGPQSVIERCFQTLKDQIMHGRVHRRVAEVRTAVAALHNDQ